MQPPDVLPFDSLDLPSSVIEERFRWARDRGHPHWLWPDVAPDTWRAMLKAIERVAATLLAEPDATAYFEVSNPGDAGALNVAAYTSGLGPLLGYWIEAGRLDADPALVALLRLHLAHGRKRAERLGRELRSALDVLAVAGIHATVLKGAHTSRAYFPEPGVRPAADIDLAVGPSQMDTAAQALAAAGYGMVRRQRYPLRSDWAPPASPIRLRSLEIAHAEDPYTIDLHASLDRDFFGIRTVSLGTIDEFSTEPWPACHPSARVLRQPLLAAYLAVHASEGLHNLTLLRLTELVQLLRTDSASGLLEWDELAGLLKRDGALRFAYPALELAERWIPGTLDAGFRQVLKTAATPRMISIVDNRQPSTAQRLDHLALAERFMWADRPVEYLRRALYMVWPAWIGASYRHLVRIYIERAFRLLRSKVVWDGRGPRAR